MNKYVERVDEAPIDGMLPTERLKRGH